jgi:sugar phosphate isomerase/epimerase
MRRETTRRGFLRASFGGALGAGLVGPAAAAGAGVSGRLAVCSWSLQPQSAEDLLNKLAATSLTRVQVALDPIRENRGGAWSDFAGLCTRNSVTCVSGMVATAGEDYATLDSIKRTGGVVPDATWKENWRTLQADAELAQRMGLKLVTFHAGFLPHDEKDAAFSKLQSRVRQVADLFAQKGIGLGLETGQETAESLAHFLKTLDRANVGVNFDPANMILYDKGEPVAALRTLAPWLRQCHIKDAVRTKVPGMWGQEVPVGTGQVDWKAFFQTLREVGFKGDLCIEREAGEKRVAEIRSAREHVEKLGGPS